MTADHELLELAHKAVEGDAAALLETLRTLVRYEPRRSAVTGLEAPLCARHELSAHQRAPVSLVVPVEAGLRGLQWATGFSVLPDVETTKDEYESLRDRGSIRLRFEWCDRVVEWPMRLVLRSWERRGQDASIPALPFDQPVPMPRGSGAVVEALNGSDRMVWFTSVLHGTYDPYATAVEVRDALHAYTRTAPEPDPETATEEVVLEEVPRDRLVVAANEGGDAVFERVAASPTCGTCGAEIGDYSPVRNCRFCRSLHHEPCWTSRSGDRDRCSRCLSSAD